MRLTEPLFSTAAAGLALIASAAAIPVTAYEPHPELNAALTRLEGARYYLNHTNQDFHGHRAKALEETNEAINEVHQAINSDR